MARTDSDQLEIRGYLRVKTTINKRPSAFVEEDRPMNDKRSEISNLRRELCCHLANTLKMIDQ